MLQKNGIHCSTTEKKGEHLENNRQLLRRLLLFRTMF
jgi:hypothetical protein